MFAILGALLGAIIDVVVLVCLALTIIFSPFLLIGWIIDKIKG